VHRTVLPILSRLICLWLLLVTITGCSRTDMLYGNADWLLNRWAIGLLDPDSEQADAWQLIMQQAMQTHERELLPQVVVLLNSAELMAGDGLESAELACWSDAFEQLYQAHAKWAVTPASEVLSDLSAAQIDHLAAELRERNQSYRDDYLDADLDRRKQERLARYVERIERWTGDLTTAQLRMVELVVADMPDVAASWLAYREQRQQELLALLRSEPDRAALQDYLAGWWVQLEDRPVSLVEDAKALRVASLDLVLRLDALLTASQRANFLDKVADLRGDLERRIGGSVPLLEAGAAKWPCVG